MIGTVTSMALSARRATVMVSIGLLSPGGLPGLVGRMDRVGSLRVRRNACPGSIGVRARCEPDALLGAAPAIAGAKAAVAAEIAARVRTRLMRGVVRLP